MKNQEIKYIIWITLIGFILSLVMGVIGSLFSFASPEQLLCYHINDTLALAACVIGSRYVGIRGYHVAASGLVIMGIVHGISAGGVGGDDISAESARLAMPMIPSIFFIATCTIFPKWLRLISCTAVIPFILMYWRIKNGYPYEHWTTTLAYAFLAWVEIGWGIFMLRDYRREYRDVKVT